MAQMQMQQHVTATFTQRFQNDGQYGPWWAYLTDSGSKYASYTEPNIPLQQALNLIVEPKGGNRSPVIKQWSTIDGSAPAAVQQQPAKEPVDWDLIGRQKSRCALVAPLGVALFQELPEDQRTVSAACEIANQLLDYVYSG